MQGQNPTLLGLVCLRFVSSETTELTDVHFITAADDLPFKSSQNRLSNFPVPFGSILGVRFDLMKIQDNTVVHFLPRLLPQKL